MSIVLVLQPLLGNNVLLEAADSALEFLAVLAVLHVAGAKHGMRVTGYFRMPRAFTEEDYLVLYRDRRHSGATYTLELVKPEVVTDYPAELNNDFGGKRYINIDASKFVETPGVHVVKVDMDAWPCVGDFLEKVMGCEMMFVVPLSKDNFD